MLTVFAFVFATALPKIKFLKSDGTFFNGTAEK